MTQQPLLNLEPCQMADTSLSAYETILPTLSVREVTIFRALYRYIDETGYPNATGGELAAFTGLFVTSIRPRLTGLDRKGWIQTCAPRKSRVPHELVSHPYAPCVPLAAIDRMLETVNEYSRKRHERKLESR